ncbi:N-acetylmuramoyl-L-alanine amidase|uniref:N-acetylmuramoyl-L-alanine amidase n=1 Tax=Dendrosporobacter quercicolus TaxID=146817 RepID=A0A1H0AA71_9FIRM|nr:N-acetylmuramoyl-L-alanine amidase [Dendrosporobacter quercicolus]NSL50025.1 N-acetylmuramoyl-L-alanine amidase [Dendrosporobacter quercicolus DSM 1736]SDN30191.1 N-acetylmuramoyl-L-alanine amidase [Dendrosporobacter quercicolus]
MIDVKETYLTFGDMVPQSVVKMIIIHHVGDLPRDVAAAEIHQWHLDRGWSGIGYHYVIRRDGSIERGRPEEYIGSHTYGYNTGSIGINLAGNMEIMTPAKAQIESAAMLIADVCNRYDLTPDSKTVLGHRDLTSTACPGKNLYEQLQTIRGKAVWYQHNGSGEEV